MRLFALLPALLVACSTASTTRTPETKRPRKDIHLYTVDGMWKFADGTETYIVGYVAYNDQFAEAPPNAKLPEPTLPSPTIRVKKGDEVHVYMHNVAQHCSDERSGFRHVTHTIHFHGLDLVLSQDGTPNVPMEDGVQGGSLPPLSGIPEGGVYEYKFIAEEEGTFLYHCHVDSSTHIMIGMYGAFIVEGETPNTIYGHKYDREYVLLFSEMDTEHNEAIRDKGRYDMLEWKSDFFLLNGRIFTADLTNPLSTINDPNTRIVAQEGETVLLRLLAIGYGHTFAFHPHAYHMKVVGTDGRKLDVPYWKDTIPIVSGERYDVLVPIHKKKNMICPSCGLGKGISIAHDHNMGGMVSTGKYPRGPLTIFEVK